VNLQGGAHRALGVIAVGDRRAEQRHRRVADVLVDGSAEAVHDRVDQREETLQQRMDVFRIQLRRQARVADQITEEDRDWTAVPLRRLAAALYWRRDASFGKEPPAAAAIPIAALVGVAAFAAGRRQRRAAGRAKFATFPVFELAALAAQCWTPSVAIAATLSSGRL